MKDLALRLAALDPVAGDALRVITYFDQLVEGRAGLQAVVRGAAVLSGAPARLVDPVHRLSVRVLPDGTVAPSSAGPEPDWMHAPVLPDGDALLWLERPGPAGPVEAMIVERAAGAARAVLDRTRPSARPTDDPASLECVLDPAAPEPDRQRAARRLGLGERTAVRALALTGGRARVVADAAALGDLRAGIGPAGPVAGLPASYAAARLALRLTAEGTEDDPGPRLVHADRMGGLAALARSVTPTTPREADVLALDRAAAAGPGLLVTLDAVATAPSLRTAATALHVHHSTLHDRLGAAERLLGWEVQTPEGRLRLQLALVLRRLHRAPA
jgi:hypothetical protein